MRQSALVLALVAVTAFAGCHKKPPVAPPPPPPAPATPPPAPAPTPEPVREETRKEKLQKLSPSDLEKMNLLQEIHFDYDKADIREGDRRILAANAETLKGDLDFVEISVEGHCDERGTAEYNTALGERRAKAAYDYLVSLGVPAPRLKSVSYGKEVPLCTESNEACWARNRRGHFAITKKLR